MGRDDQTQVRAWKDRSHPVWLYRMVQVLVGWFVRLIFACRRQGVKKIPKEGQVILASNHVSNLDPLLVVVSMHRPVFHLAKAELFKSRFTRWFFETLGGQIAVDRRSGTNRDAIDAGVAALEEGLALGIYPEGGRSADGRLKRGKSGVARIAYAAGAPIFPVAVLGTYHVWPKGRRFPRLFSRTRVVVGDPILVEKDPEAAEDSRRASELTEKVMLALADLLGEEDYDPRTAGWVDSEEPPAPQQR